MSLRSIALIVFAFAFIVGAQQDGGMKIIEAVKSDCKLNENQLKPPGKSQARLLELAFDTASAIPVYPHIKDRSKSQQNVVEAYLELGLPQKAVSCTKDVENWRKGICFADISIWCAKNGQEDAVECFAKAAEKIAKETENWRRDRIRVRVEQARILIGTSLSGDDFEEQMNESEKGKVAHTKAMLCDDEGFSEQVKVLDEYIAVGTFDLIKNALDAYAQLFNRFYEDEEKRRIVEDKIESAWSALPIFVRVELMLDLSRYAVQHKDNEKAKSLIDEAQAILDAYTLRPEHRIEMMAKLIKARSETGDVVRAGVDADTTFDYFKAQCEKIVNIYRAQALVQLAEAYQLMGQADKAMEVYKRCVQESVDNPNSRPRAQDLAAVCCSMALSGFEPDESLWSRLSEIRKGLAQPW